MLKKTAEQETQINRFQGVVVNASPPVIHSRKVLMTVNGPVIHNKGGKGVILKDDLGRLTKILVLVNGNKSDISSYRADIHVIYSGYKYLYNIMESYPKSQLCGNL